MAAIKKNPEITKEYFTVLSKHRLALTKSFLAIASLMNGKTLFLIDNPNKEIADTIVNAGVYNPTISVDSKYPRNNLSIELKKATKVETITSQKPISTNGFSLTASLLEKCALKR